MRKKRRSLRFTSGRRRQTTYAFEHLDCNEGRKVEKPLLPHKVRALSKSFKQRHASERPIDSFTEGLVEKD